MRLALREMRRRPGRFATATVLLTLIAMLLMLLGGLLDGLILRSTGAIRAQRADLVVFSSTAEKSFLRSRITPEVRAQVADGAGRHERGRHRGHPARRAGARATVRATSPTSRCSATRMPPTACRRPRSRARPTPTAFSEDDGVERGDTLRLGPARSPVKVIGFVDDVSYSGAGSLWASPVTWRDVQNANRPGVVGRARRVPGARRAHRPRSVDGRRRDRPRDRRRDRRPSRRAEAADAIGGVRQQRSVFNQIIGVTLVIAVVVVALFFALLTVERIGLYGMLKAIGARSRTLFGGVVAQAAVVALIAAVVGAGFAVLLDVVLPPGAIPYQLLPSRVAISGVALVLAAIVGSAFSLRRVLRVDPASAIGRAS